MHRLKKRRFLTNRKWRHGDIPARERRTHFSILDSERVTPSLWSCPYDIICLSSTASSFWLGFPHCRWNLWGFRGKWPQNVKNPKNTCSEGISLRQTASFELYRAWSLVHRYGLSRFRDEFGVTDTALNWLKPYNEDRHQVVKLGRHSSATVCCNPGVPPGSVLGLLIFTAYASPIGAPSSVCRWYLALPSNVYLTS